ncbi:MAG: glucuronate isomerase [Phaeodactylibacter xiamenensis]|uniref:Uronate isomerase n=1 Tax=Phaeodactylibacter xiamenensis TaxID=1524460 RepID=A0A098S3N7_9BACT|nr:glucuronate isomerase [Phaeodactylibacter xiamenensis]KGE86745.1 glucuronate isomerase [Phaeodactylibacter xiamenensis]MCR9052633.1 glucuronate isomerase [bacterium]
MSSTITQQRIKPFLNEDFLLENQVACALYHDYAKVQPIIDYHNHLPPDAIAKDAQFANITKVWLDGDHYKWRAMRTLGVDERFITGDAPDREKFRAWAKTVPYTMRNPLYHWTHLELQRYFGVTDLLHPDVADEVYDITTEQLQQASHSARGLLRQQNVELVCTTDDPVDDLAHHEQMADADGDLRMLPAFRPDKAILIEKATFNDYINKLEALAGADIQTLDQLLSVLESRIQYFHDRGCRLADHGLECVDAVEWTMAEARQAFADKRSGMELSPEACAKYRTAVLTELGKLYHQKGWVWQLHLGALRNNSSRMMQQLGPDTGFDSMGDWKQAQGLSRLFDTLDRSDQLPRTILYNLNPADNEIFATMAGNFNDGSVRGKMQFGSGWWFLDQKDGMEKQMNALSNLGLLSCFIGMLTDSRSFLSFPRHEYFRRILCNLIGRDVHNGQLPNDVEWLGKIVADICYHNAKNYFNF